MQKSLAYKMRLPTGSAQMNLNLKARLTQKLLLLLLKFILNTNGKQFVLVRWTTNLL